MLEQTFDCTNIDHEIFVVNDNSVDKTPDLLEQLSKKYDAIWLTLKGFNETHLSFPLNLYGWDCETVFIMNPNCVTEIK